MENISFYFIFKYFYLFFENFIHIHPHSCLPAAPLNSSPSQLPILYSLITHGIKLVWPIQYDEYEIDRLLPFFFVKFMNEIH